MADFKVGDKVRATEALAAEVKAHQEGVGRDGEEVDQALIARATLVIVDIVGTDFWPVRVALPGADPSDYAPLAFHEIEHVED